MRAFQALLLLVVSLSPSLAGQVVTASFDDLTSGTVVGSHYPGLSMPYRVVPFTGAHSAPHAAYCGITPFHFPSGALWTTFYTVNVVGAWVWDTEGVRFGAVAPVYSQSGWDYFEIQFDRPIGSVELVPYTEFIEFDIDDLSYEIVPEPSCLAAGAGVRRRRRG